MRNQIISAEIIRKAEAYTEMRYGPVHSATPSVWERRYSGQPDCYGHITVRYSPDPALPRGNGSASPAVVIFDVHDDGRVTVSAD